MSFNRQKPRAELDSVVDGHLPRPIGLREREREEEGERRSVRHTQTHTHTHTQTHRQTHTLMSLPEWENDQSCYHKHYGKENKESFAGFLPFRIVE